MTDELPPDQPQPDAPNGADSELVSADELDEVLSQAAALATDLSSELGVTDGTPDSSGSPDAPAIRKEAPADLDRELNDLQQLVATAGEELNDEPASPNDPGGPDTHPQAFKSERSSSGDSYDVPDFMSEFTEPQQPDAAPDESRQPQSKPPPVNPSESTSESASQTKSVHIPKPGVVGTGMIGVVGTAPPTPAVKDESPAIVKDDPADDASPPSIAKKSRRIAREAGSRLSPLALRLGLQGVRVLERIDRPIRGVSRPVRRLIGWIAIATLGTATIVFLISLL